MVEFAAMEGPLTSPEDKLQEAEFFLMLMNRHLDEYEFRYFLSAFLSGSVANGSGSSGRLIR